MDLSQPARTVVPTLDADVLIVLLGTTMPATGRQIQRLARSGSQQGVAKVLLRLEETGLVSAAEAGAARLYLLNRDHVAFEAVAALADLRGKLFDRIRHAIEAWAVQPLAVSVFGSAARGDGSTSSDIDLLFVRPRGVDVDHPDWSQAMFDLAQSIFAWSGNRANTLQVTVAEVAGMVTRKEPIVAGLKRDERKLVGPGIFAAQDLARAPAPGRKRRTAEPPRAAPDSNRQRRSMRSPNA